MSESIVHERPQTRSSGKTALRLAAIMPALNEAEQIASVIDELRLVDPTVDSIEVSCTPTDMPNEFVYDVTDMEPDTVIRLSDIPMPKGVTALGDPDMAVVTVLTTAAEIEEPAAAEEGEGEGEGEEAAAEGDAAATPSE